MLSECISEVNEELLVFDFEYFKHSLGELNEMDLHRKIQESGQSQLLLHPVMQAFLHLKWDQAGTAKNLFRIIYSKSTEWAKSLIKHLYIF